MAAETNGAPLTVKVMRISAPLFAKQSAPYFEDGLQEAGYTAGKPFFDPSIWQDVSESFGSAQSVQPTLVDAMARDASLSEIVTLPPSFGAVVHTTVHGSRAGALDFSLKNRERTFVQVQVQNVSTKPIVIENFATGDLWECELIEQPDTDCSTKHLLPNDVMQFLLILTPSDPDTTRLRTLEQLEAAPLDHREVAVVHTLGSLGIDWRIPNGEKGSWRSSAIMKRTKRAASVLCDGFAGTPRLVTQYAYQKPEKALMLSACLIEMRIIIDDLNTLREAGRDTSWQKHIVLEAIPETWTEMSLLGPQRIQIIPNETFTIQVTPLHDGIVRAGGMVLKLCASEDKGHFHESRVLKKWQCLFELLAEKTIL